jgi:uncharacterized protein YggE
VKQTQANEKNFIDRPYIEVLGKAEMEIIPNEIYLEITVDERNNKKKQNVEQIEKEMISELQKLKIDVAKDLQVKDMSSNFKSSWLKSGVLTIKQYQLLVRDAAAMAKVYGALENIGISEVKVDKLDHSDLQKFRKEVRINAVKDAQERAGDLATAVGQSVGKALYISFFDHAPLHKMDNTVLYAAPKMLLESGKEVALDFRKIRIEVSVNAKFILN